MNEKAYYKYITLNKAHNAESLITLKSLICKSQGLHMVNKAKAKGESCVDKVVLIEWVNGLHTALCTKYSMYHPGTLCFITKFSF